MKIYNVVVDNDSDITVYPYSSEYLAEERFKIEFITAHKKYGCNVNEKGEMIDTDGLTLRECLNDKHACLYGNFIGISIQCRELDDINNDKKIAFSHPKTLEQIKMHIANAYFGDDGKDGVDLVDIPAILNLMNDQDFESGNLDDIEDSGEQFFYECLAYWISKEKPELKERFPDLDYGEWE